MFSRTLSGYQYCWLKIANLQQTPNRGRKVMIPLSKGPPAGHMRRLFEAVTEPILPTDPKVVLQKPAALRCTRSAVDQRVRERMTEFSPRELALNKHLRKHLLEAVVVIVCHEHPADTRTQHYDLMEMSSNGIAFARQQQAKVMRSVLEHSTLERLASFFDDDVETLTSLMYTKRYVKEEDDGRHDVASGKVRDGNYLPLALRYAKRMSWIVPLAVVYEDRMLTVSEAEKIAAMLRNPMQVRAETVAILNSPMVETGRLLTDHTTSFTASLQSRIDQLKSNEEKTSPDET